MKIEFNEKQMELLKEVISEYTEMCYQDMLEYKKIAVDVEDSTIKQEYNALAESEEERFSAVKKLEEYIEKYESLMADV